MEKLKKATSIFDRNGLAALSDLNTSDWRTQFLVLELEQNDFLFKESLFRSTEYKWPLDPLHTWSRVWEYPFVYHHLRAARRGLTASLFDQVVIDFGSGVTFFPFAVAKLGYRVICADIDPVCERDITAASRHLPVAPGSVEFRLISDHLPTFRDGEADIIYCISVLEHIPDFEKTVDELCRILKKGGILILTIDLNLKNDSELGVAGFKRLQDMLSVHFDRRWPEKTIHPADVLFSNTGPYPVGGPRGIKLAKHVLKHYLVKPLLGQKPSPFFLNHLAVCGLILEKR
jgi:2-polyprenyl-3-methyl-5-hydroxy-6-metoxy-1,4-benzoquinol methylase